MAAPQSYQDVGSAQAAYYISDFNCTECPLDSVGCEKSNKYEGGGDAIVKAVAAPPPLVGYYSMTCFDGTTRTEGCRKCRKIEA